MLDRYFLICNIYGPYFSREAFWDNFWNTCALQDDKLIIRGDMNFSLGHDEIWGDIDCKDPLSLYFQNKLEEDDMLDVESTTISATWCNNHFGSNG
jgi:hypothetical protein